MKSTVVCDSSPPDDAAHMHDLPDCVATVNPKSKGSFSRRRRTHDGR